MSILDVGCLQQNSDLLAGLHLILGLLLLSLRLPTVVAKVSVLLSGLDFVLLREVVGVFFLR